MSDHFPPNSIASRFSRLVGTFFLIVGVAHADEVRLRIESIESETRETALQSISPDRRLIWMGPAGPGATSLDDLTRLSNASSVVSDSPTQTFRRTLFLAQGGTLDAEILETPADARGTIRVDAGLDHPLDVPLNALVAVRFTPAPNAECERRLAQRIADRPADKDMLVVPSGENAALLPGSLDRLDARGWSFTIGKKTQDQPLDSAYAVIIGGQQMPRSEMDNVRLTWGGGLSGRVLSADQQQISIDAGLLGKVSVPWKRIRDVSLRSQRIVYLSDLKPDSVKTHSALDLDLPPRMDESVGGRPLMLRGQSHEKGVGVHARTILNYKIAGQFERLVARVGIDDLVGPHGSVVFRVMGDGKKLFESSVVHGGDPLVDVSVPLIGVQLLTLECDDAGDLDVSDHADWADARLIRPKAGDVK